MLPRLSPELSLEVRAVSLKEGARRHDADADRIAMGQNMIVVGHHRFVRCGPDLRPRLGAAAADVERRLSPQQFVRTVFVRRVTELLERQSHVGR